MSQFLGHWHKIMFIATRAMQQHQRRSGWIVTSDEVMGVSWESHNEVRERRNDLNGYR